MKKTTWIVDDSTAFAESAVALLAVNYIQPVCSIPCHQLLAYLRAGDGPRLLILDLKMGDIDGNDLLREIIAEPRWTFPIIVITAWSDCLLREVRGRVFKVLDKGCDPLDIIRYVKLALGIMSPGEARGD